MYLEPHVEFIEERLVFAVQLLQYLRRERVVWEAGDAVHHVQHVQVQTEVIVVLIRRESVTLDKLLSLKKKGNLKN